MTNCRNCGHSVEEYHTTINSAWARGTPEFLEGLRPKNGNILCYRCVRTNQGAFGGPCSFNQTHKIWAPIKQEQIRKVASYGPQRRRKKN